MTQQWTVEEEAVVREEYRQGRVWVERARCRLPERTDRALSCRASHLGLTKQVLLPWIPSVQKGRLPRGFASRVHRQRAQRRGHG